MSTAPQCVFCRGEGGQPGHETSECRFNPHNRSNKEKKAK